MALIPAKCTQCGANITVDNTKEAGICESCGTPFITEKVINNYTITNNIHADVINIVAQKEEFEIVGGELVAYKGVSTDVIIPDTVKTIGRNAFDNCRKNLTSITFGNGISCISAYACGCCTALTSIKIPSNVKEIGESAFGGCTSLTSITIPDSVTSIGDYAFCDCKSLASITIPDSVTSIGGDAFSGCKSLTYVKLSESLNEIPGGAFSRCKNLKKIDIPANIATIGRVAFWGCSSLAEVNIANPNCEILKDAFTETPCEARFAKKKKGCYVATCVYGSYDCPEVWTLRRFRDDTLASTWYGRAFIHTYYAISPTLVKWFGETTWFKKMWQGKLDKMVESLRSQGVEDTPYQDKEW